MNKELVLQTEGDQVKIALLEDGRLMEFHQDNTEQKFNVGDVYLAKVKKLAPAMNAAFVNIGAEKDAFLHYHDLGPQVNSLLTYTNIVRQGKYKTHNLKTFRPEEDINKDGKIDQVLQPGQNILVQITKEPISTKGPRITSEISIPGRYLVLVPFSNRISVSQKIKEKAERKRLLTLIESIRPEGFGVIIRTVAQEKKVAELHADLTYLQNKWQSLFKKLDSKKVPTRILTELDKASSILRDKFSSDFTKIYCDDADLVEDLKEYLNVIASDKANIVEHYTGNVPAMEKFGVERQIKHSFGTTVNIPASKGAYLVIEHTEALHVIDVNSGNIKGTKDSQEKNALEVNMKAAGEVARQLRLRDMGGIVVVDFIDMRESDHKKQLFQFLKDEMKKDNAKHKVLPPSRFGLIQITRQRVRPELTIKTLEKNPNTNGEVEAPIVLLNRLESQIKQISDAKSAKKIWVHAHPFVAAYLRLGLPSIRQKWAWKYKLGIKIVPRDAFRYLQLEIKSADEKVMYQESN